MLSKVLTAILFITVRCEMFGLSWLEILILVLILLALLWWFLPS
jgi:hypothetical protein